MAKTIRKGAVVRYIGKEEAAQGMEFKVHEKCHNLINVSWPTKYLDGSVHTNRCYMQISDFELVR